MKAQFKAFTRKISLFLALSLVVSLLGVMPAMANPTHISTAQDLVNLAATINSRSAGSSTSPSLGSIDIILDNDIDMSGVTNWQGIGVPQSWIGVTGTFNGNGKKIIGISLTNTSLVGPKGGLFNLVADMTIKNLKVTGSVTSNRFIGGIVGRQLGTMTINNCIVDMTLTLNNGQYNSIGGLVGQLGSGQTSGGNTVYIEDSAALGTFTSNTSGNPVGGLVGHIYSGFNVAISNSYVAASLSSPSSTNGSLIANNATSTLTFTNCRYLFGMSTNIIGTDTGSVSTSGTTSFTAGNLNAATMNNGRTGIWKDQSGTNVFNSYSYPALNWQ